MRRRLRSFAASWLLNALLRIFAMSIITPKRKVLRMSVQDCWRPRSAERFSRNAETDLVCRLLLEKKTWNSRDAFWRHFLGGKSPSVQKHPDSFLYDFLPDPHTFPTRRSSDLEKTVTQFCRKLAAERPLKDIRDEYNYPKKKGIKDECSRLLEA